ncbi:carboxypeptidase regulatory-like domain-containing protein [Leeuwenhoekiella polynyae]|uniref:Carboxypeptidase family protein n=1 Tax=Leeuwenhoekiella polynyae TaxID=1550906 RepID=A0A4Q0NRT3_9FLAO|nr:carboxypeptidase regulatory-like domain-containing protein [Leeuwenhoekiella polynyae]RXG13433.1 carboxypeptidase family protein [Leeuwenhoekiella polynyae]
MKIKRYIISILIIAIGFYSCSEDTIDLIGQGTLTGRVVDDQSKTPIANVRISTNPASSTVFTDEEGRFTIEPIAEDDYAVQAELDRYVTAFEAVSVRANQIGNVVFEMVVSKTANSSPIAPELIAPIDNSIGVELNTTFIWSSSATDSDDITYDLELRNTFSNTKEVYSVINDTILTVANLNLGTTYFWQVSANDGGNEKVLSQVGQFRTINLDRAPFLFTRLENGNSVIYAGVESEDNGYTEYQLTSSTTNSFRPRANAETSKIAFLRTQGGIVHLFTMNADGSNVQKLSGSIPVNGFRLSEIDFAWSQNGSKIYYPNFDKLYSIGINGSGAALIYQTPDGSLISEVATSEFDQDVIAIKTNNINGYQTNIYTLNLSTQLVLNRVLTNYDGAAGGLDLDANGNRILYTIDLSGSQNEQYRIFESRVFIYDFNSGINLQLDADVDIGENDLDPRWSPSEGQVVLTRQANNLNSTPSIYSIDLNSNNSSNDDKLLFSNASMPDWE